MRLYLAVTFWGEEYRRYFLDFCLASLLAPGNIPAIIDKASAKLLIATNDLDWAALQAEPTFIAARNLIQIEQVAFHHETYCDSHGKMLVMSRAHKRLANRMFEDGARGVFLYPDMLAASGFIGKLQELCEHGFAVVMFMNVRFANEGIFGELNERGFCRPGEPIVLSARELARLTIRHMHSEMRRSNFGATCDDFGCSSYFWVVSPGEDLLFHCGSWIPSLIDYGSISRHDDSTFDSWTLDGDYIAKNLTDTKGVYFVRDTSELFMISFTPESSVHFSLTPILRYRFPKLRERWKIAGAHTFLFQIARMDWLRREQFRHPVHFRGGDSSESQWRCAESRAARIIARMEHGTSADQIVNVLYRCNLVFHWLWRHRLKILRRVGHMLRGDRAAWRQAKDRLQRAADYLADRPVA